MKRATIFLLLAAALAAHPKAGWSATLGLAVGGQGAWFDDGGHEPQRDLEATGRAALSITPHISAVGGIAYGFMESYVRGSVGARATVTDATNKSFSIGIGFARHFESEPGQLDEWAGEAAIGWKPLTTSDILITAAAAYGLDSGRRMVTAGVVFPVTITAGGAR